MKSNIKLWFLLILLFLFDFSPENALVYAISETEKTVSEKSILKRYRSFRLDSEILIDTANKKLLEKGLFDITDFDIDSKGNIYLLNNKSERSIVFKFNSSGNFIQCFGRKGQGPGEIEKAEKIHIINDRIFLHDTGRSKILVFGEDGNIVSERKVPS